MTVFVVHAEWFCFLIYMGKRALFAIIFESIEGNGKREIGGLFEKSIYYVDEIFAE